MSPAEAGSPYPIHYLGDSHVRYFRRAAQQGLLAPGELTGLEVGGATAVGMRNPNAKTNAIGRYRDWISDKSRDAVVVTHLGEVDCGFVIWYRAAKYDERVQAQARQSVDASVLRPSDTHTTCPWKGLASYYTLAVGGAENRDAAWYYPDPKPAATEIRDRIAFWKGVQVG